MKPRKFGGHEFFAQPSGFDDGSIVYSLRRDVGDHELRVNLHSRQPSCHITICGPNYTCELSGWGRSLSAALVNAWSLAPKGAARFWGFGKLVANAPGFRLVNGKRATKGAV